MTPAAVNNRLDVEKIRKDFPILEERVNGHPLAYLDNASTTQKPASSSCHRWTPIWATLVTAVCPLANARGAASVGAA